MTDDLDEALAQAGSVEAQMVYLLRQLLGCCEDLGEKIDDLAAGMTAGTQALLDAITAGNATIASLLNQILQDLAPVPGPATSVTLTWRTPIQRP